MNPAAVVENDVVVPIQGGRPMAKSQVHGLFGVPALGMGIGGIGRLGTGKHLLGQRRPLVRQPLLVPDEHDRSVESADPLELLEGTGYERYPESADIIRLANCPFHQLAQAHTDLVCGMNLHLLQGLLDAIPEAAHVAELDPGPDRCCVRLRRRGPVQGVDGPSAGVHQQPRSAASTVG